MIEETMLHMAMASNNSGNQPSVGISGIKRFGVCFCPIEVGPLEDRVRKSAWALAGKTGVFTCGKGPDSATLERMQLSPLQKSTTHSLSRDHTPCLTKKLWNSSQKVFVRQDDELCQMGACFFSASNSIPQFPVPVTISDHITHIHEYIR